MMWLCFAGVYFGCGIILIAYLWFVCKMDYKDWVMWLASLIAILLWPIVAIDMIISGSKDEA